MRAHAWLFLFLSYTVCKYLSHTAYSCSNAYHIILFLYNIHDIAIEKKRNVLAKAKQAGH